MIWPIRLVSYILAVNYLTGLGPMDVNPSRSNIPKRLDVSPEILRQAMDARADRARKTCEASSTGKFLVTEFISTRNMTTAQVLEALHEKHLRTLTCNELRDYSGTLSPVVDTPRYVFDLGPTPSPPEQLDSSVAVALVPDTASNSNLIDFISGNGVWPAGSHFPATPL